METKKLTKLLLCCSLIFLFTIMILSACSDGGSTATADPRKDYYGTWGNATGDVGGGSTDLVNNTVTITISSNKVTFVDTDTGTNPNRTNFVIAISFWQATSSGYHIQGYTTSNHMIDMIVIINAIDKDKIAVGTSPNLLFGLKEYHIELERQ